MIDVAVEDHWLLSGLHYFFWPNSGLHYWFAYFWQHVILGGIVKNTLRPPIPERCDPEWRKLMEECWSPDPDSRPSFTEITGRLRSMSTALQSKGQNQARRIRPIVHSWDQGHTSFAWSLWTIYCLKCFKGELNY